MQTLFLPLKLSANVLTCLCREWEQRAGQLLAEVRNEGSRACCKLKFLLALLGSNGICLVAVEVPTFETITFWLP